MTPLFDSPTRSTQVLRSLPPKKNRPFGRIFLLVEVGGIEPPSEKAVSDASTTRRMSLGFSMIQVGDTQNPISSSPRFSCMRSGVRLPYPEKMTRRTGLSGVLPLRAAYLCVSESEVVRLEVRRSNSTGAVLGTFKVLS